MAKEKRKKSWLKSWIDGEVFLNPFWGRQIGLIALIAVLVIVYVGNRYAFQQEEVQIQRLREKLEDVKYEALARSSELMEKSRESNIQRYIEEQGSALQMSTRPPVVIKR